MQEASKKTKINQRTMARLGAIQALYQMDIGQISLEKTLKDFTSIKLDNEHEKVEILPLDHDYLCQIVRGVTKSQLEIDPQINVALNENWTITRLDATLLAILRSATFEILFRPTIPVAVIISEYVDIAKLFLDTDTTSMVNAILDKIAKTNRKER